MHPHPPAGKEEGDPCPALRGSAGQRRTGQSRGREGYGGDGPQLPTNDGLLQFNLGNQWQIEEYLGLNLERGYTVNMLDQATWQKASYYGAPAMATLKGSTPGRPGWPSPLRPRGGEAGIGQAPFRPGRRTFPAENRQGPRGKGGERARGLPGRLLTPRKSLHGKRPGSKGGCTGILGFSAEG